MKTITKNINFFQIYPNNKLLLNLTQIFFKISSRTGNLQFTILSTSYFFLTYIIFKRNNLTYTIFERSNFLFFFLCLFPVNILPVQSCDRNTRKRCKICSEFTIKSPEWLHWLWTYLQNYKLISHIFLEFTLLTLKR